MKVYSFGNSEAPVLHEQDMQHEELLACHPEQWARLVKEIAANRRQST